ncbi:hypothetical protein, partial [Streptomyces sasae]|uniref:hypothetical protein n=1 Tax=Streptomyces sasae TaxID=1266772 RepID=UPI00292CC227
MVEVAGTAAAGDRTGGLQAAVEVAVGVDGGGGVAAVRVVVVQRLEELLERRRVLGQVLQHARGGAERQGDGERGGAAHDGGRSAEAVGPGSGHRGLQSVH